MHATSSCVLYAFHTLQTGLLGKLHRQHSFCSSVLYYSEGESMFVKHLARLPKSTGRSEEGCFSLLGLTVKNCSSVSQNSKKSSV